MAAVAAARACKALLLQAQAALSPSGTSPSKRFGDYVLEWEDLPPLRDEELGIPVI